MPKITNKIFTLEHQFQLYLKMMGLKESSMHPVQRTEIRRAFMGACGQIIVLLRDDLSPLSDDEGADILQDMLNQVQNFLLNEAGQHN